MLTVLTMATVGLAAKRRLCRLCYLGVYRCHRTHCCSSSYPMARHMIAGHFSMPVHVRNRQSRQLRLLLRLRPATLTVCWVASRVYSRLAGAAKLFGV